MKIVELIEVRKPKGFAPDEVEVVIYTLFEHHSRLVQSTSSGNPYWHNDNYELLPGDVVIREARYRLVVRGDEDVHLHIEYYLRGEILAVVREDETAPAV